MDTVGLRIKNLRKESKITQYELAKYVHTTAQVISNIERGYSKLDPELLGRIADHFNVPADYILCQTDARNTDIQKLGTNILFKRLPEQMALAHINEAELAQIANIKECVCLDILAGKTKPNVDTLAKIARTLNTTIDYLIGATDYAIAVSNEDEEDILKYFRGLDRANSRRFLGMLQQMIDEQEQNR